jgi:hypothetical protein
MKSGLYLAQASFASQRSQLVAFQRLHVELVKHNCKMAPKRAKDDGDEPVKKKVSKDDVPKFDERWKVVKPSLIYIGDDMEYNSKIAAFDLDGTLVEWKEDAAPFSVAPDSWVWFNESVPKRLKVLDSSRRTLRTGGNILHNKLTLLIWSAALCIDLTKGSALVER